jgi:predicted permease
LSIGGGVLGLVFAWWSFGFLRYLIPTEISKLTTLSLDYRVLLFTLAVSLSSGILFGAAPAAQLLRGDLVRTLKETSAQAGIGRATRGFRTALVCTEVALCFVLLVGAALLIQTFARLRGVDLGFAPADVLTARIQLSRKYGSPAQRREFYTELLHNVQSLPGVVSAGITTGVPLVLRVAQTGISVEGGDGVPLSAGPVNNRSITPDYLKTIGVPLLRGRPVLESDGPDSLPVALVNETLARRRWPNADAMGRRLKVGVAPYNSKNPWITVVGIVRDIKQAGLDVPSRPEMYLPLQQEPESRTALAVRTHRNPLALTSGIRAIMRKLDPELPLLDVATMEEVVDREVFQHRIRALLLGAFAGLALLIAALGVYGVVSYLVAQSTHDIGVRVALGASPRDVVAGVLRSGLKMALIGVGAGCVVALALTKYLGKLLFGVGPRDLATFLLVALALAGVTVVAAVAPARKASRIDPITALRYE